MNSTSIMSKDSDNWKRNTNVDPHRNDIATKTFFSLPDDSSSSSDKKGMEGSYNKNGKRLLRDVDNSNESDFFDSEEYSDEEKKKSEKRKRRRKMIQEKYKQRRGRYNKEKNNKRNPSSFAGLHDFALKYGIKIVGEVGECLFCFYGCNDQRKVILKRFTKTRSDRIMNHINSFHKPYFKHYDKSDDKRNYFTSELYLDVLATLNGSKSKNASEIKISSFFKPVKPTDSLSMSIPKRIVNFLLDALLPVAENAESTRKAFTNYFQKFDETSDKDNCILFIKSKANAELAISFVAAAMSFKTSLVALGLVKKFCNITIMPNASDAQVRQYVQLVCAINFNLLSKKISSCWGFSIAFDCAKHQSSSYISLRIRFVDDVDLHDMHVMFIPLRGEHTGINIANHIKDVLSLLCTSWESKLVGITSDGARSNLGKFNGAVTHISNSIEKDYPKPIIIWCILHQLDIVMKDVQNEVRNGEWIEKLTDMVGHLRKQYSLINEMKSTCPYLSIRWNAAENIL